MTSFRRIVKHLIPQGLFARIEPYGHLAESVIMTTRYGFPGRRLKVIGVTGTNGKTTTSFFIHRLLLEAGIKVGLMTTVANGIGADIKTQTAHITSAQSSVLQRRLRDYADAGVEWVVVETSSHSLSQYRVWGVPYQIAVLTNITHEHLDYHKTFERYVEAKRRLFTIANKHGMKFGVVNADDPSCEKFSGSIAHPVTYGIKNGDVKATNIRLRPDGSDFTATVAGDVYDIHLSIPGDFNISNSLAALAVGRQLGLTKTQIEHGLAALTAVEGRMSLIDEGQAFTVIVDFASTPDAFERVFHSVTPRGEGKLIAVFGSAGRRDEAKRPIQGAIAAQHADILVLTEEDDRDVDGSVIQAEIARGAEAHGKVMGKSLFTVPNREEAIGFALTKVTSPDDIVLLLGKGHERTIERADGEHPWNESELVRAALQAMKQL